jgi:hypothetical protein
MTAEDPGLAASIHQRLLNQSKARRVDFNLLLVRFAIERFLYRLSQSPYADQFVLKGAMLLQPKPANGARFSRRAACITSPKTWQPSAASLHFSLDPC